MQRKPSLLIDDSTEDLLALVNELTDENEEVLISNDTYVFLQTFKLKTGKFKVLRYDLYKLYKQTKIQTINALTFYTQLNEYIKIQKNYAYINRDLSDLIKEITIIDVKKDKDALGLNYLNRYNNFLKSNNIENGKDIYISCKALYYFYDKWTYENKLKSMIYSKFKRLTEVHLENTKQLSSEISYGVSNKFYEKINEEDIKKAKDWAKKYKPTKQK